MRFRVTKLIFLGLILFKCENPRGRTKKCEYIKIMTCKFHSAGIKISSERKV